MLSASLILIMDSLSPPLPASTPSINQKDMSEAVSVVIENFEAVGHLSLAAKQGAQILRNLVAQPITTNQLLPDLCKVGTLDGSHGQEGQEGPESHVQASEVVSGTMDLGFMDQDSPKITSGQEAPFGPLGMLFDCDIEQWLSESVGTEVQGTNHLSEWLYLADPTAAVGTGND